MAEDDSRGTRSRRPSDDSDSLYDSGCKRRRRSSSDPASRSFTSNSDSEKAHTENVSNWMKQRAENLGVFYAKEATDITELCRLISKIQVVKHVFDYPFTGKHKQISDSLVEFIKHKLKRTTELVDPVLSGMDACYNAETCEKIFREIQNSRIEETEPQLHWYLSRTLLKIEEFYAELLAFHLNRWNRKETTESDLTKLLSRFTEIFLLSVEPSVIGSIQCEWNQSKSSASFRQRLFSKNLNCETSNAPKRIWKEINGVPTGSTPNLRLQMIRGQKISVAAVVQVEEGPLKKNTSHEKFKIEDVVGDRVLGQHAGELLLGVEDSAFGAAVLGILCIQTSIMFTYLGLSVDHMDIIEDCGDVKDRIKKKMEDSSEGSGTILYTKPYNYLEEKGREEMVQFLVWLGLQTMPGIYRLQKQHAV